MLRNDGSNNKESSSMALSSHVINLDSKINDILDGKNYQSASESECKRSSDADVGKNSEYYGVVHAHNEEERTLEALTMSKHSLISVKKFMRIFSGKTCLM